MKKRFVYEINPVEKIIYRKDGGVGAEIQTPFRGKNYRGYHYYLAEEKKKNKIKYIYMGTDIHFEVKL